jgi:ABC-type dipeptide/oligopeptide/nickel transport system permease component
VVGYLIRRIGQAIIVLVIVTVVTSALAISGPGVASRAGARPGDGQWHEAEFAGVGRVLGMARRRRPHKRTRAIEAREPRT